MGFPFNSVSRLWVAPKSRFTPVSLLISTLCGTDFCLFTSMGEPIGGCADDLLLRLSPEINTQTELSVSEPPDLTLRLSLGGIYCGKSKENSLTRSSSVIGVISQNAEAWKWDVQAAAQPGSFLSLARSCSLPAETEHLGRIKLKELQLMRRMEAKKRLAEQRSGRAAAAEDDKSAATAAAPPSPSEVAAWAAASAAKSPALCRAIDKIKSNQGSLSQSYTVEGTPFS